MKKFTNTSHVGKVIIPANTSPWPHELHTARILSKAGHSVEFLPKNIVKTADIKLDGIEFEIKSPLTDNPQKIIRNIKRALQQSHNVIIDSARIKSMRDDTLAKLLVKRAKQQQSLERLLLVTKRAEIIDITSLI